MKDVSIKDLLDLVVSNIPDPENIIQKMFEWHLEREITIIKWVLGFAASLTVAGFVAYFNPNTHPNQWEIVLFLSGVMITAFYGAFRLWQLRLIHKQFVSTLTLVYRLKTLSPFLSKYRQITKE